MGDKKNCWRLLFLARAILSKLQLHKQLYVTVFRHNLKRYIQHLTSPFTCDDFLLVSFTYFFLEYRTPCLVQDPPQPKHLCHYCSCLEICASCPWTSFFAPRRHTRHQPKQSDTTVYGTSPCWGATWLPLVVVTWFTVCTGSRTAEDWLPSPENTPRLVTCTGG